MVTPPIALVARPDGAHTGVGRYVQQLTAGLRAAGVAVLPAAPAPPPLPAAFYRAAARRGADIATFLTTYPVRAALPPAAITHYASQNLASALLFQRPRGRVVVTVHDIIPHMLRRDPASRARTPAVERLFDTLAMRGLCRADHLIADSVYTAHCLRTYLQIPAERVSVAYLAVEHGHYRPVAAAEDRASDLAVRLRHGLRAEQRYLIYVGSEDPRKDLVTLLRALGELRLRLPDVTLVKVGRAHFAQERARLLAEADLLGIGPAVRWLDDVPEAELPALYRGAAASVLPSRFEGFGLPALEALACGVPAVVADATSLPEVVGAAGVLFRPGDSHALAAALLRLLTSPAEQARLRRLGLERAAGFTTAQLAAATIAAYQAAAAPGTGAPHADGWPL